MRKITLLIVDDEPSYLSLLKSLLEEEGYQEIITEQFPEKVLGIIKSCQVDIILLDVYMPLLNGIDLLEKIQMNHPRIPVIIVTGVDEVDIALKAVKLGAYDYILKPTDTDRLFLTIKRALEQRLLEQELDSRRVPSNKQASTSVNFSNIITSSPKMHKIFELIEIYAPTNEMMLISGEEGTGKNLIAQKIHQLSSRRNKPFIAVNIASISNDTMEGELFGMEKGEPKSPDSIKKGLFEEANGGTIFLDGIDEVSKDLQEKLLRTIQYNEICRIGSSNPIKLDLRIISSTKKDLARSVVKKEFRADLHYRINRASIQLPPLKERGQDIILLAHHFIKLGNVKYNRNIIGISSEVKEKLSKYDFPGNVKELEYKIYSALEKTDNNRLIEDIDIQGKASEKKNQDNNKDAGKDIKLLTLNDAIKNHILSIMDYTKGNTPQAAFILGVSERTLLRWLKNIRIK